MMMFWKRDCVRLASAEKLTDCCTCSLRPPTLTYYRVDRQTGRMEPAPDMNYERYKNLSPQEQEFYECLREKINHPAISGPFDTAWGMTDFDTQLSNVRLGLPNLPGQVTEFKK